MITDTRLKTELVTEIMQDTVQINSIHPSEVRYDYFKMLYLIHTTQILALCYFVVGHIYLNEALYVDQYHYYGSTPLSPSGENVQSTYPRYV